ncbi:glucan synthase-like 8 [Artemisia annua]|uniref:1,3-beta-glucan synthase n=1 Tax=Artemisia annua TaxID=35608 RepID=A0A2U1MEH2_ARTAN|nr:glucan synthase-like 8 [Artemisia annua]
MRPATYRKLEDAGFEKWSRAYCPANRYNYMTSNSVESINSLTKEVQRVPITMLMDWYRQLLQRWYFERRSKYEDALDEEVSDWATAKIYDRIIKSVNWTVKGIHKMNKYEVKDNRRDENWVAKISDFGLSKLSLAGLDRSTVISHPCGTMGYCEPEYMITGILSKESDVYSFGIVLFEVLCRRLCIIKDNDDVLLSGPLAKEFYESKRLEEIIDPSLKKHFSSESVNKFSEIAYRCLHYDRKQRPTMDLVAKELEDLLEMEIQSEDAQVARILCETAYTMAQNLDPNGEGIGALKFNTGLASVIKQKLARKDGRIIDRTCDAQHLWNFYQHYKRKHRVDEILKEEQKMLESGTFRLRSQETKNVFTTLRALVEVMEVLVKEAAPDGVGREIAEELKRLKKQDQGLSGDLTPYNIVPLEAPSLANAIGFYPEIRGAISALRYHEQFPRLPGNFEVPAHRNLDMFDLLEFVFGFQIQSEDAQVARILCETAYTMAQNLDPNGEGIGALKFNTGLASVIKQKLARKDGRIIDRTCDAQHLWNFYQHYKRKHRVDEILKEEQKMLESGTFRLRSQETKNVFTTLRALVEVMEVLVKEAAPDGVGREIAEELKRLKKQDQGLSGDLTPYNIVPLEAPSLANAIGFYPEIRGAISALRYHEQFPRLPGNFEVPAHRNLDMFDLLEFVFGFQKDNIRNQRENVVLSIANAQSRLGIPVESDPTIDDRAVTEVFLKVLDNYIKWCKYLRMARELVATLDWGEASPAASCVGEDNSVSFLAHVIQPIYDTLSKEADNGKAAHSAWRNYDDFNEYFWSPACFELSWPMKKESPFLQWPKNTKRGLTIVAFNHGKLNQDTFKTLLSIGPTYAILKFIEYNNNVLTLISIWAPIVAIYLMDIHIFYTLLSAVIGGVMGARARLGKIRSIEMLHKRFDSFPEAFVKQLVSTQAKRMPINGQSFQGPEENNDKMYAAQFSPFWNEIIKSLREEDYISNRQDASLIKPCMPFYIMEMDLLSMPSNTGSLRLVQWPLFLLSSKIYLAIDLALDCKDTQADLWSRIIKDEYMKYAVQECYYSIEKILLALVDGEGKIRVERIFREIEESIKENSLVITLNLKKLPLVLSRFSALTGLLIRDETTDLAKAAAIAVFEFYHVVTHDLLSSELSETIDTWNLLMRARNEGRPFSKIGWPRDPDIKEQVKRLNQLLKLEFFTNSATIPKNLEARRRLEFFTNSLFMHMPAAKPVSEMMPFCVFTPYYSESVLYSTHELNKENEDGISTIFYLQKMFPDEWDNFLERIKQDNSGDVELQENSADALELRFWVSYRGQTLARTVRGMMYYRRALMLQSYLENRSLGVGNPQASLSPEGFELSREARAQADIKFTYVVSCQIYGQQKQKKDKEAANIALLLQRNEALRVAFIHVEESAGSDGKIVKSFYSKLVKADILGKEQEIYSIKLPGDPKLGEGKPENENHAIVFTRGEAVQTIDMNQDNYLEEAMKMRNLLEEFRADHGLRPPTILGVREHVFTGSVSSLAWFMSNQETSFVTLGQRVLAYPLKVRMHYGHPDVFDRIFHISRGGISKASRVTNISEDMYAGFNSTLRQGNITYHEYIQLKRLKLEDGNKTDGKEVKLEDVGKQGKEEGSMSIPKEWQYLEISLEEIKQAAKNFQDCIGKGGYGLVYKGELYKSGKPIPVAIKRSNEQFGQGIKEFLTEIQLLSGNKHPNLISLLGYCVEDKEKILVYEYAEHGSLDQYLRPKNTTNYTLTWHQRLKICAGAARGLDHLHYHVREHFSIIHRDIKSANILLDQNWVAKVSDLGLSKLTFTGLSTVISHACGTLGYCEPEYAETSILKKESDVYSFGIVLFEVLCGRLCFVEENGIYLSDKLAKELYNEKRLDEIVDPSLKEHLNSYSMNKFSEIAYRCLCTNRQERPPMHVVIKELEDLLHIKG